MKLVNPSLVNALQKMRQERLNNEEVCGNQENKEKYIEKWLFKIWKSSVIKVKNELKLNVDEQQDAIKHLSEYCDIDDIDPNEKLRLCV